MAKFRPGDRVVANKNYEKMGVQKGDHGMVTRTLPLEIEISNNVSIVYQDQLFGESLYDLSHHHLTPATSNDDWFDNSPISQHVCKDFKEYVGIWERWEFCTECDKRKH